MRHSTASSRTVPSSNSIMPVFQYSSKKAPPPSCVALDTAATSLARGLSGAAYSASTRRHSTACPPCSPPSRPLRHHNNNNGNYDNVFLEDDDGVFPMDQHRGGSSGSSAGSSPLTMHRKVERSHSEPQPPLGLFRDLSDHNLAKNRYKTELCRAYLEAGHCKYGEKCQFAHGKQDLRQVNRHPKYKTEHCRSFHATGICQYGARCHFIHHPNEAYMGQQADDTCSVTSSTSSGVESGAGVNSRLRDRSVSLCVYPQTVPDLGQQARSMDSFVDSLKAFSSYSSSPQSMSPGLHSSWPSEEGFFGSTSAVNMVYTSYFGYDEQQGPWRTAVDSVEQVLSDD